VKILIKILKNYSLNLLWILMFLSLWPLEDYHLIRLSASFLAALLLAVFQVLFKEN
jgi:hypothetical protein